MVIERLGRGSAIFCDTLNRFRAHGSFWPTAAIPLDRVTTAAFEGATAGAPSFPPDSGVSPLRRSAVLIVVTSTPPPPPSAPLPLSALSDGLVVADAPPLRVECHRSPWALPFHALHGGQQGITVGLAAGFF